MNEFVEQLEPMLEDEELINALSVLPVVRSDLKTKSERLTALIDIYKIYIPTSTTIDIYNRLYLSVVSSLEKKNSIEEIKLLNENYKTMKGLNRYGIIGGIDSFRLTGNSGVGKTSAIQRCSEIITQNRILKGTKLFKEIIPILEVETVSDCSIKNLLYSILVKVDEKLGTNFYELNNSNHTTTDVLLSAVSTVLSNHVALLCIDEIERVVDNKRGITLLNYLTQLINQSTISICFVGTESSNQFFEMKEYLARRTLGISLKKMSLDRDYYSFCRILFNYQYTLNKIDMTNEIVRWFYSHSNGLPSMTISLYVEAQREAILSGKETIDLELLTKTYRRVFSTMSTYVEIDSIKYSKPDKEDCVVLRKTTGSKVDNIFDKVSKVAYKDADRMIELLSEIIIVEYI